MLDVVPEHLRHLLAVLANHIGVDVREILAGVHSVLIVEKPAGVIVGADPVHEHLRQDAFQTGARLPVQQHAAEIEDDIGDRGLFAHTAQSTGDYWITSSNTRGMAATISEAMMGCPGAGAGSA